MEENGNMSDSNRDGDNSSSIKISHFHGSRGENYGLSQLHFRSGCSMNGVWDVVKHASDEKSKSATSLFTEPCRVAKRERASGIITLALGDVPLCVGLEADDGPGSMVSLLYGRYAPNSTVSRIVVQTQLFNMPYYEQSKSTYIDQYISMFAQLNRLGSGSAIPEAHNAQM